MNALAVLGLGVVAVPTENLVTLRVGPNASAPNSRALAALLSLLGSIIMDVINLKKLDLLLATAGTLIAQKL